MPNAAISGLTASAANLAASDVLPVVQTTGVGPVKMTGQQLAGGLLGSNTLNGATLTANAPVANLTQTWNNAAVTFTGMQLNITDTASNAASLLMDLQVGGITQASLTKAGVLNVRGNILPISDNTVSLGSGSFRLQSVFATTAFRAGSSGTFDWTDLILRRRAASNLQLGPIDAASATAQTLSVQGVVAGTTNVAGVNFTIAGSQGTGTGAGGSLIFQVAPAGSSGTAQNALVAALTINADRSVTVATSMTIGDGGGTNGTLTIGVGQSTGLVFVSRGKIFANNDGVFTMRDNAGTSFGRLTFGGVSSSFPALKRSTTFLQAVLADDSAACGFSAANVQAATAYTVATLPTTPGTGMIARVTDALAPAVGTTVAAGGAAYALVNYNGANWTVIGV